MKKPIKIKITSHAFSLMIMFLVSYTLLVALLLILMRNTSVLTQIVICALASFALNTIFYLYFRKNIYKPIANYEDALDSLYKYNTNIDMISSINPDNLVLLIDYWKTALQQEFEKTLSAKQATLSSLQSQINPHFLYNTLDSIRGEALDHDVPVVAEMTEALSSFFRYSVSKDENLVPLREEIRNVKTYFKIQQYRFSNKFKLNILFDSPAVLEFILPKLTLQPIIENSIYHGLEPKREKGIIDVRIVTTDSRLLIIISDNGTGIRPGTLSQIQNSLVSKESISDGYTNGSSGIALKNINQRIKLLFGNEYGLFISSFPDFGTEVEVVLPLEKCI